MRPLRKPIFALFLVPLLIAACGGGGETSSTSASGGAGGGSGGPGSGSGGSDGSGGGSGGSGGSGGGSASACDEFGRFGVPENTFTLPSGSAALIYSDIQKSFPEVDWSTLDRLYIPAGSYKAILLGNLPDRDASRPLVITNIGGQVQVGPNDPGAGYLWSMTGGSNWILTGRFDPDSKTGDAAFPGHRCGDYAGSRGKYGFFSDDAFATGQYLHMGISVSDATSYEIEYLELFRSGFAGVRLLNKAEANKPPKPLDNVRLHDLYLHDIGAEGFYIGWTGAPPSNIVSNLKIYNNRVVRAGNEALQIQNLGDGVEVHHNVFAFAALRWRYNELGKYQDNNSQVQVRAGSIALHHNIFLGGAATLLNFFSGPEAGDADRSVTFSENYFADALSLGAYLGGTSGDGSTYTFAKNHLRGFDFGYADLDPAATDPGVIFRKGSNFTSPIVFDGNTWEGPKKLIDGLSAPNGTAGSVTATGNVNGPVAPIELVSSGLPSGVPTRALEEWAPKATVAPGSPAIVYKPGDFVMHNAEMFECIKENSEMAPPDHPEAWKKLPAPVDDVRVVKGSTYAEMGVY